MAAAPAGFSMATPHASGACSSHFLDPHWISNKSFALLVECHVVAINTGSTHCTEFGYDGRDNRVRITEMEDGQVTSDNFYVAGEERDAASGQVLRKFFGQGEQRMGGLEAGSYFYAGDHLGSLRTLTDVDGAVQASYGYALWGERTKLQGNLEAESGFTGYWHHQASGLEASPTRLYNVGLGRFLSRDPIAEYGGMNLYRYVENDPIGNIDPSGLDTYRQNRLIGSNQVTGNLNPISHTFVFTTNTDGTLKDAYSWGNSANTHGWNINQPEDCKAAQDART